MPASKGVVGRLRILRARGEDRVDPVPRECAKIAAGVEAESSEGC